MKKNYKQGKGMVDISGKAVTKRRAVASATIGFSSKSYKILIKDGSPKGDVFESARIAAIMAAKSTPAIIPHCHPLELGKVQVDFKYSDKRNEVTVVVEAVYKGRTGVEMEALTAASAAALTIYDMMKWSDKGMIISDIKLLKKTGGKSGDFKRRN